MTRPRRILTVCLLGLSLSVSGCAGSSLGNSLQQSLAADPQLAENPPFGSAAESSTQPIDPASTPMTASSAPEPGQPDFIGPVNAGPVPVASPDPSTPSGNPLLPTAELAQVPEELRRYVGDLLALDLLTVTPASSSTGQVSPVSTEFKPNQGITRGDYARWLLTVNNRFYADQPDKQIRAGVTSATPAFKDVPTAHPDFEAIQGLAEAGLIPSALTGNVTAVNFRPEDPLTRKDLLLWKVPLDTRQGLPAATVDAVKEAWGFQDAGKIDPLALRALLADYQNGEFANVRRAFGYTTLFQPDKAVTQAEAAVVLWRFGSQTEGISAAQVRARGAAPAPASATSNSTPASR